MEPETTRPDLAPSSLCKEQSRGTADSTTHNNNSDILPRQKIEALLISLERSSAAKTFADSIDEIQKRKLFKDGPKPSHFSKAALNSLTSSNIDMVPTQLSPSEIDDLDNLDILDKIFQPLPPSLSDQLQTNYNYASIGKKLI